MNNNIIIKKMLNYIDKILTYCRNTDYEKFRNNTLLTDGCVFNLSQLGELAAKIDTDFAENHSEIPWKQMRGLRNKIVHDYEGVNLLLVWEIISDDLPELKEMLQSIER